MKVINIHSSIINQPINKIAELFKTLSTETDKLWPKGQWTEMKFKDSIKVGAEGEHGPIKYSVEEYKPNRIIQL